MADPDYFNVQSHMENRLRSDPPLVGHHAGRVAFSMEGDHGVGQECASSFCMFCGRMCSYAWVRKVVQVAEKDRGGGGKHRYQRLGRVAVCLDDGTSVGGDTWPEVSTLLCDGASDG